MNMYTNGAEWIIAESPIDAIDVWNCHIGDNYIDDLFGDIDDWVIVPDNEQLSFWTDGDELFDNFSEFDEIVEIHNKPHDNTITFIAPAHIWVQVFGRSYFLTTEI